MMPHLFIVRSRGALFVSGIEAAAATSAVCEDDRIRTGGGWLVPQRFLADLEAFAKHRRIRVAIREKRAS